MPEAAEYAEPREGGPDRPHAPSSANAMTTQNGCRMLAALLARRQLEAQRAEVLFVPSLELVHRIRVALTTEVFQRVRGRN